MPRTEQHQGTQLGISISCNFRQLQVTCSTQKWCAEAAVSVIFFRIEPAPCTGKIRKWEAILKSLRRTSVGSAESDWIARHTHASIWRHFDGRGPRFACGSWISESVVPIALATYAFDHCIWPSNACVNSTLRYDSRVTRRAAKPTNDLPALSYARRKTCLRRTDCSIDRQTFACSIAFSNLLDGF